MSIKIEIECPYCEKVHVHTLDGLQFVEKKKEPEPVGEEESGTKIDNPDLV